jgi:hypothetical protein
MSYRSLGLLLAFFPWTPVQAAPGDTTVAAYSPVTGQAVLPFGYAASADGQFVAFGTDTQVLASVVSPWSQAYLRNRATNQFELVSRSLSGQPANGNCGVVGMSANARFVLMNCTDATNLIVGDSRPAGLVLRERSSGTTQRVAPDNFYQAAVSGDGRYVAFASTEALASADRNTFMDVYLWDRQTLATELVSVGYGAGAPNEDSFTPNLSSDGRWVKFASRATNLVPGDTNGTSDVFVRDRLNSQTRRVNVSSEGAQANGGNLSSYLSANGNAVLFSSFATNLVAGDSNGTADQFVHDLATGKTERVSLNNNGRQSGRGSLLPGSISGDGRFVAFADLGRLTPNDVNSTWDIFVRDRQARTTVMVSVNSAGEQAIGFVGDPIITTQATDVFFDSRAGNLTTMPWDSYGTVFVHELQAAGAPSPVSVLPATVKFGSVRIGTVSDARVITITNTSTGAVPIQGVSITGPSPGQFLRVIHCPASLATGAACTVEVRFAPTSAGAKTAKVNVNLGSAFPKAIVWLNGTGSSGS